MSLQYARVTSVLSLPLYTRVITGLYSQLISKQLSTFCLCEIQMDTGETLLLVAMIAIYFVVFGIGTMLYCCAGFHAGLPFAYLNEFDFQYDEFSDGHFSAAKDLIKSIMDVSASLKEESQALPRYKYITDKETFVDLELGLQREEATQTDIALNIEEKQTTDDVISIPGDFFILIPE